MDKIVIEQTNDYPKRMKYDPDTKTFYETEWDCLSYVRGVTFPYGWLKDSGTPPAEHLDVILISRGDCNLGDELPIRIIGVFKRHDHDHKLVAVHVERHEVDIAELPDDEKTELYKLYPRIDADAGEGWFGAEIAIEVINDFYTNGRKRVSSKLEKR